MRLLWVGMLLASLPVALLAQNQDRRPFSNDLLRNAPLPPVEPVTQAPADGSDVALPPDDSVTATPLPPPDQDAPPDPADAAQQLVPNPLDTPPEAPAAFAPKGTAKQAQPQGQPQSGGWVQMGTATLQALDKVNARSNVLAVKVGGTGHFGSLDIAVRGCFVRTPDKPADATAFLVIRDQRADSPSFTGWVVRSAPYMSMLAHPIYDVRITGCTQ